MTAFISEFSREAAKYIRKLDFITKERLRERIGKLENDPFPQGIERVQGQGSDLVFRIRVGDQRILYIVRYHPDKIIIVKIDKRSRVYN